MTTKIKLYSHASLKLPSHFHKAPLDKDATESRIISKMRKLGMRCISRDIDNSRGSEDIIMIFESKEK